MIFRENRLPADDSHEMSCLICNFWKSSKILNCRLLQITGGALWVSVIAFSVDPFNLISKLSTMHVHTLFFLLSCMYMNIIYKFRIIHICPTLPGPQIRVRNWKLFFLFLNQNICCGYSKKKRLNETVLLRTQNTCLNWWIRKQSQFYDVNFCLTGLIHYTYTKYALTSRCSYTTL